MKKTVSPRIDSGAHIFYEHHFKTTNSGVQFVLESFPELYQKAIESIDKKITQNEILKIREGLETFSLRQKVKYWDSTPVLSDSIKKKIESLSGFEQICLFI